MRTRNIPATGRSAAKASSRISLKRIAWSLTRVLACLAVAAGLFWWGRGVFFLQQRAEAGELEAQYLLGQQNFKMASSRDETRAGLDWILKAAEGGHAKAQTALGIVYGRGIKVAQSPEVALSWLTRAALQGEPLAQNELATMYAKGSGAPRNLKKAMHWYRQAAASGSRAAGRNLFLLEAAQARSIDLTTRSGKFFPRASLRRIDPDGITLTFQAKGGMGLAKVKAEDLPAKLAVLCEKKALLDHASSGFEWSQLDLATAQM